MKILVIESCEQYPYLGTVFTPRNNFKTAQNELYKKACRAFFGYLKYVNICAGAQITTVSKLFNSLVAPILLYNYEIWGAFMNNKKLQRVNSFVEKMFDDKNKHELLQLKMAKIALGVHKKSNNMAVRGELGLYPLNIDIYIRMIKYFLRLKDIVVKENKVIEDGITESINLVRNRHECWLAAVLFIFKTVGTDFDLNQRLMLENEDIIKEAKDKCRRMFEDKFFNEIRNSSRLLIFQDLKKKFQIEPYINEVKYYKYRSAITKFRISAHSLPIERGRWMSVQRNKRICPLYIGNDLGDENHYIFHCTNINLVEIREKFSDEIYKTSPDIVPKTESCFLRLTKLILSDKCELTWTTIGKFLSKLLNTTEEILLASNEPQI